MAAAPSRPIAEARALWRWWLAEIGDMVPAVARLTRATAPARRKVAFDAAGRAVAEPIEADAGPLALELPDEIVLIRTVSLPRAARANVAEIAGARLSWETPFTPETAYYGFAVGSGAAPGELALTLAAAPKGLVDACLDAGRGASFAGAGVFAAPGGPWISLVAGPARAADTGRRGWTLAFAALLLVALAGPLASYRVQSSWMAGRIAALAPEAEAAADARAALRALTAGQTALAGASRRFTPRTRILNRVSELVAAPAWIYRLQLTDQSVEIFGYADDPGTLVAALEAAPDFDAVSFRSPTVRDETTGKQRFHIGAVLAGGGP